jgi:hypothetical protein
MYLFRLLRTSNSKALGFQKINSKSGYISPDTLQIKYVYSGPNFWNRLLCWSAGIRKIGLRLHLHLWSTSSSYKDRAPLGIGFRYELPIGPLIFCPIKSSCAVRSSDSARCPRLLRRKKSARTRRHWLHASIFNANEMVSVYIVLPFLHALHHSRGSLVASSLHW